MSEPQKPENVVRHEADTDRLRALMSFVAGALEEPTDAWRIQTGDAVAHRRESALVAALAAIERLAGTTVPGGGR